MIGEKNKGTKSNQSMKTLCTNNSVQKDLIIFIQVRNIHVNYDLWVTDVTHAFYLFHCGTTMFTTCYNGISQVLCSFRGIY